MLELIQALEEIIDNIQPSIIYTHHRQDLNIDHKITHDVVMTACRPQPEFHVHQIFCFEVPSSTGWNDSSVISFLPNYFIDISKTIHIKLGALEIYNDEMRNFPHVRSIEAIKSLIKYRGSTVGYAAAEAFTVARIIKTS
jgi:LmbE family N-acetylglucosaminyl deacetylase